MSRLRLIGIHGKARSGKDVFADLLTNYFGFKKVAYADLVKDYAIEFFGLTYEQTHIKKDKEVRQILQGIGSSARHIVTGTTFMTGEEGKSGYPDWVENIATQHFCVDKEDITRKRKYIRKVLDGVFQMYNKHGAEMQEYDDKNYWIRKLFNKLDDSCIYVVKDVRYLNELFAIRDIGNPVLKVERVDKPAIEAGKDHESETDLDEFTDWFKVVQNEKTKDWEARLLLDGLNIVRALDSMNFFTEEDKQKFTININEYK